MTLSEVRPFGDRLIVRPDAKIGTTDGGLVIPDVVLSDNPNYFYMTGVVLKLGDGVRDDTCECQNRQCRRVEPRRVNGRCSQCGATQALVAAGERRPFDVEVGDRVLFNRFAGKQIEVIEFTDERIARYACRTHDSVNQCLNFVTAFVVTDMSRVCGLPLWHSGDHQSSLGGSWPQGVGQHARRVSRFLILRESEVFGTVDGDHRVLPGYEAPAWARPTSNPGDKRPGA